MLNINLISALWVEFWSGVEASSAVLLPWAVVVLAGVLTAPIRMAYRAQGVASEGILVARPAGRAVLSGDTDGDPVPAWVLSGDTDGDPRVTGYSARALKKARARKASGRQRPGAPILEHI